MFEDLSFSIPVDRIECRVVDDFQLSDPVEEMRTATWEATLKKRPSAFDGTLLRLAGHHVEDNRLVLSGNRTTFSAYVATRSPEFSDDYSDAQRADPLGMTAMVSTRDNQLLVTKRSLSTDQNPGALYFIGGYAEPPERGNTVDIFSEAAREVMEEIAVSDLSRSASFAIGIAYDPVFCHPEIFLLTVSPSTAAEILESAHNAADRNEAADLFALPLLDVIDERGPLATSPKTWSYVKARGFLSQHLLGGRL